MARKDPSALKKEKKEKKPKRERVKKPPPPPMPKPLLKSQQHAKWPAMFKRHLGMIESHIRLLDRQMSSMRSDIDNLEPAEKRQWLTGEIGNWLVIVGMMERARQTLIDARAAGSGILPPERLKEKKSLGTFGNIGEKADRHLHPEIEPLGASASKPESNNESDSDSSSDSSISSDEDEEIPTPAPKSKKAKGTPPPADFTLLKISKKRKLSESEEPVSAAKPKEESASVEVEPNPYFVVDVEPTPVILNGADKPSKKVKKKQAKDEVATGEKKGKKRSRDEVDDVTAPKKSKKIVVPVAEVESKVDFTEVEQQLRNEVEAGMKAQAKAAEDAVGESKKEKKEKKRKRVSDGVVSGELVVKKSKKDKKEKRKADADTEVVEEGSKKNRKHKVEEAA